MTRLTQEQIAEARRAANEEAFRFAVDTEKWDASFAHRIAALAVQEVERERDFTVNALMDENKALRERHSTYAELVRERDMFSESNALNKRAANKLQAEVATLTAQLAEAQEELATSKANTHAIGRDLTQSLKNYRDAINTLAEVTKERNYWRVDADDKADRITDMAKERTALRAQLATAKREVEHWVLDRRAELGPQPNLTKSDAERYAWAGKMTAYDAVLGYVTDAYPATPSGEGVTCEYCVDGRTCPRHVVSRVRATPSPEAREVPRDVMLRVEVDEWSNGEFVGKEGYRVRITPADAKRIGILGGWRDAEA